MSEATMNEAGVTETATPEAPEPVTVAVGGAEYTLAALGLAEVGELRAFAKARQPDPLASLKPHLAEFDERTQRVMIDQALAAVRRPVMFGSPEFMCVMQTAEGLREALWLSLRRSGAGVTRASSDAAADAMDLDKAADVFAAAFGQF